MWSSFKCYGEVVIMSNPYKEWIEDRQKDALADIVNIAKLYDKWKEEEYEL